MQGIRLVKEIGSHGGDLHVMTYPTGPELLVYVSDGAGASCAGEFGFSGLAQGMLKPLNPSGRCSNDGCPRGTKQIDLQQPEADAPSITDQVQSEWGDVSLHGVWNNDLLGTELDLQVTLGSHP